MKKNKLSSQKWYNNAVAILIGVVGYVVLTHLSEIGSMLRNIGGYFIAVVIGCVIAYMVNPLAVILQNKVFYGVKRETLRWALSVFVSMTIVVLLFILLLGMLIPQLIESVTVLVSNLDGYLRTLDKLIRELNLPGLDLNSDLGGIISSPEELVNTGTQFLSTSLKSILTASKGIGKNIVNLLLAMILSIYLLGSKESLKQGTKRLMKATMPDKWYNESMTFVKRCNNILVRYIVFTILDAIIVGGINALFMGMTGMQYIGLISVVVGVTNLIPSFGPVIGGSIGGFILLLINPWHALMFIVFTCILQTLDGYVIKPKLFGDSLGVSGLLILVSIIVFGNIFGIIGILLAIPLAAIIDFTYEEYFLPQLEARKAKQQAEEAAELEKKMQRAARARTSMKPISPKKALKPENPEESSAGEH